MGASLPMNRDTQIKQAIALRVEGISARYGAIEAVAGLSFEIAEGEVFGLLGPNGAGKTTTISMLATQRRPSDGDAWLFGHSICKQPREVKQMIGGGPQEIALYPMLTAAENLRFFGRIYGMKRIALDDSINVLLRMVGLEAHRNDYVGTFSGGMKRRLNLAAALVHRPNLILLDEPTAGVDPHSRQRILEIIRQLREAGNAILYTTHNMEEAEVICDRLGIMDHGRLIAMGTLNTLMADANCAETIEIRGLTPETNLDAVRCRSGFFGVENEGGILRLSVENAVAFLEPIQQIISHSKRPVHLRIVPPTLENLFLRLTGKGLHD